VELLHLMLTLCPLHKAIVQVLCQLNIDTVMLQLYAFLLPSEQRAKVNTQFFDTVESFCVNYFRFGGVTLLPRLIHFLTASTGGGYSHGFRITLDGQVEVRAQAASAGLTTAVPAPTTSLSQLLQAVKLADGEVGAPGVGDGDGDAGDVQKLLHLLTPRTEAVVSLLHIFEEKIAAKATSVEVVVPTVRAPSLPTRSSSSGPTVSDAQSDGYEFLASELFLHYLSIFLHLPPEKVKAPARLDSTAAAAFADEDEESVYTAALGGSVMLALQEKLPLAALLRDGNFVFPTFDYYFC
jgi:hypothetical protein